MTLLSDSRLRFCIHALGLLFVIAYMVVQWPLILNPVSLYDDKWFQSIAEEHAETLTLENFPTFVFTQTNELGYG